MRLRCGRKSSPLDSVKNRMPLLLGRKFPARVFRGSIRRITARDYEVVLEAYKQFSEKKGEI